MVDYSAINSETEPERETVVCDVLYELGKIALERDLHVLVLTLKLRRPVLDSRPRRRRGPTRRQRRRQTAC